MSSRSGQGKDTFGTLIFHDRISNALPVIDNAHRRTHRAQYYTWSHYYGVIAQFTAATTMITTGGLSAIPAGFFLHMKIRAACSSLNSLLIRLYEGCVTVPQNDTETGRNHNREQGDQYPPFGTLITPFEPTANISVFGPLIYEEITPAAFARTTPEWILKNTDDAGGEYWLEVFNLGAGAPDITINIEYYVDEAL